MLCVAGARRRWGSFLLFLYARGDLYILLKAGVRGAECGIVEARARKPMSWGLLGLHQGSEHRFRSRVAAIFRILFREVRRRALLA